MASRIAIRWLQASTLELLKQELLPSIITAYQKVMGKQPTLFPLVLEHGLPPKPGQIAVHFPPLGDRNYSLIRIHPKAQGNYLREVVKHELIHYVVQSRGKNEHGQVFQQIADLVGLPEKYQD